MVAAVVVIVALLVAADFGARIYVQDQLGQRIDASVAGADAQVKIGGFPFLFKLVTAGHVDRITAHLVHAADGAFVLDDIDITVTGVTINRSRFLQHRQLEIDHIDRGTVVAQMSQADLDQLVGVPVVLEQGTAQATVAGVTVTARVSVVNNRLEVHAAGLPVSVAIPALPVLPCQANIAIVPGRLIASCTFTQIPPALQIISP